MPLALKLEYSISLDIIISSMIYFNFRNLENVRMIDNERVEKAYNLLSDKEKALYSFEQFKSIFIKIKSLQDEESDPHSMIHAGRNVIK